MLVDLENHFQEASFKEEVGMVQPILYFIVYIRVLCRWCGG